MNFYRVYVELTNTCGLACTFCPPKKHPSAIISLPFFEHLLEELSSYTKEIALHMGGDPLTLSNLSAYLDICEQKNIKVMLTTSGYYLNKHDLTTFMHPAIKQINLSLNSYNKNSMPLSFEAYMKPIIALCHLKHEKNNKALFINLRLWNMDESHSEKAFNEMLFSFLEESFKITLDTQTIYDEKPRSVRLTEKILLHFDGYFEWPSLESNHYSQGACLGLRSHFGILSNGDVVPCCLDKDGLMVLGNVQHEPLKNILNSPRAQAIIQGFNNHQAVELVCQNCSYKDRFKEQS